MRQYGFKVVPAEGDAAVPVAVAGQAMVDIQKLLTDIGTMLVKVELRVQGDLDPRLKAKFDLKIGGSSGSGIGSDPDKGSEDLMEESMKMLCSTLDFLGKGVVGDWFDDYFPDPYGRREVARDVLALCDHLDGFFLEYGPADAQRRFGRIDREKVAAVADRDVSKIPAVVIGVIYRDPVKVNHWHISNGSDDLEITFADNIAKNDIPEFAKAGPVIVSGSVRLDDEGRRTAVTDVSGCYTFPMVKFQRIITPQRDIPLLNPAIGTPGYDAEKGLWHLSCELLGIDESKPSWDECVLAFHDYFEFLWETYCDTEETFEGEEAEVQEYLRSLMPVARLRASAHVSYRTSAVESPSTMSRRRISHSEVARIGEQRISRLLDLSVEALRAGRADRARRYVDIARRIGMKTRVGMPKDRRYCKGCLAPLVPGLSCTIRLNNGTRSVTCGLCGKVWRMPYDGRERT